jgi:hypothetical protein
MGHFPNFICRMKPTAYAKKVMLRVLTSFPTARPSTNFVIPNRAESPVRNLLFVWIGTARGVPMASSRAQRSSGGAKDLARKGWEPHTLSAQTHESPGSHPGLDVGTEPPPVKHFQNNSASGVVKITQPGAPLPPRQEKPQSIAAGPPAHAKRFLPPRHCQ